ncbi:MAG: Glutathione-regulated potassium-efflux system protein KefC [Pseudomonadales bacterium]|nr:Glutathione-regulated potassium-efflux system protein KefC [Pseudomonadales bacterium]
MTIGGFFAPMLLLLAAAVVGVLAFRRLNIPSSLAYLLVGVLFGAHTPGPVIDVAPIRALAEFGIVFLLFTIGLNFSMPQIHALRHQVLWPGTAQVALTTVVIGIGAWLFGLPPAAAFVVGAVFAQSSTTVISRQLAEQGEEHSRHARLGIAMSVFQDVTAVPFVVVFPVLAVGTGFVTLGGALGLALAKAAVAFALIFVAGRWLLRPLFHLVAEQRSADTFTLTVLLVSLAAAWTTSAFGLSMAFGAFLAGMMLGETEFRHQVESTVRPFRDVLLGLFFVGIGMIFDPFSLGGIWHLALLGAATLLAVKTLLVAAIVRAAGSDWREACRVGLLLAVGGEFGFALLAIALENGVIDTQPAQIALASVLFSIVLAPLLIRHNHAIARALARTARDGDTPPAPTPGAIELAVPSGEHVVICGYGRIGQGVARLLDAEHIGFVALDLDPGRTREAYAAGEKVFYGDAAERDILVAAGIDTARLLVITQEDLPIALGILRQARALRPTLPVMVRTRDERHSTELREAGATEIVAETLEASLMIAVHALALLGVPRSRLARRMIEQYDSRYRLLRGIFPPSSMTEDAATQDGERLHTVVIVAGSRAVGRRLEELELGEVTVNALVRNGVRAAEPSPQTLLAAGDALVLFGSPAGLRRVEETI